MGFSYRKSMKVGPVRVTASKSGISYSAGVPGARVTRRADGRVQTTVSAPGTGLRYTTTHTGRRSTQMPANPLPYQVVNDAYAWQAAPHKVRGFWGRRVILHPDHVELRRGLFQKIILPAEEILEIRVGAPTLSAHGYVWFVAADDPLAVSKMGSGATGVVHNRHIIMFNTFRPGHRRKFRELAALLSQR